MPMCQFEQVMPIHSGPKVYTADQLHSCRDCCMTSLTNYKHSNPKYPNIACKMNSVLKSFDHIVEFWRSRCIKYFFIV